MLQMKKNNLSFIGDLLAGHSVSLEEICSVVDLPFNSTHNFLKACGRDPVDVLLVIVAAHALEVVYGDGEIVVDDLWRKELAKAGILCSSISFRTNFKRRDVDEILARCVASGLDVNLPSIGLNEVLGAIAKSSPDTGVDHGDCCGLMEYVAHATLGPLYNKR